MLQEFKNCSTVPSFVPGGCTGYIQPLDVSVNAPLKALIEEEFENWCDRNYQRIAAGGVSVSEKGIELARWVGAA